MITVIAPKVPITLKLMNNNVSISQVCALSVDYTWAQILENIEKVLLIN